MSLSNEKKQQLKKQHRLLADLETKKQSINRLSKK